MALPGKHMTPCQLHQLNLRNEVYEEVFSKHLNLEYTVNQISINELETILTVFLPCTNRQLKECENYYFGHGFGGSSVMYFYLITDLLKKGNVILWEIRGMGFSTKLPEYQLRKGENIEQFFIVGIGAMLQFYNHANSSLIGHSLSGYLILLFILRQQQLIKKHVKQALLLSPVGITAKQQDYKYNCLSCLDFFYNVYQNIIWCSNFNFKTPFKLLCCNCCRDYFINKNIIDQIQLDEKQSEVMLEIVKRFLQISNGSQNLFFQLFEANVLPKIPIQPLFIKEPDIKITLAFGVDKDWADKTGATKLAERFPSKIQKLQIEEVTHNIAFHTKTCKELFDVILK